MVGVLPHLLGKCLPLRIVIGQLVGPVGQIEIAPCRSAASVLPAARAAGNPPASSASMVAGASLAMQPQLLTNGVQQLGNTDGF